MTQTDDSIRSQITASLGDRADAHDIDAIVSDYIATYGLAPVASVDRFQYRDLIQRHDYDLLTDD